jgi:Ca2+-transporting ATPase
MTVHTAPDGANHTPVWHALAADALLRTLATTSGGLNTSEAAARHTTYGANELQALGQTSAWQTLAAQFQNVLIVILLVATLLSGLLGHALEAAAVAVIVLLSVLLGFIQEHRAERALEALRLLAAPMAHVVRDGVEQALPSRDLVPGDLIVLRAGDRVPADARITLAVNLTIDEAALTGESAAVVKTSDVLPPGVHAIADRSNMAYAGTVITAGRGQGVVVATGMATEFGRISGLVQTVTAGRTPLQENLDALGRTLGLAALGVVAVIVAFGLSRGMPLLDMLMFGIASPSSPKRCRRSSPSPSPSACGGW